MTALRIGIALALLLVVALGAGMALLPRLVAWDDYREELTQQAEALTGQTVAIQGRIDLELLPRPTLTLARTTLSSAAAPAERALRVDRLDLRLKPLALLGGRFEVDELRLVRPVLQLGAARDATGAVLALAGGGLALPLAAVGPTRLSVVDGRAVLDGTAEAPQHALEAINFDLAAAGPHGPYTLRGDFMVADQAFEVTARLGQVAAASWSTLHLELSARAGDSPARLSFHGLTWSDPQAPRLRGELNLAGSDARAGLLLLAPDLRLPAWSARRFRLAGHLEFAERAAELDDLRLELADTEATGSLRLTLAATPTVDLQLDLPRLAAPAVWLPDGDGLRALAEVAGEVAGEIDLSIGELEYRGDRIRRLRATLALDGQGGLRVEQARAALPGQTTLTFSGGLVGAAAPALEGDLAVVVNDLPAALGWLDLAPAELPPGRLRTSTLASRLVLSDGTLRFIDAELRVDASRLTGSLALSLGARLQLAGALALDRLNLDAYWPEGEVQELAERTLALFGSLDAALAASIERITWHDVRLQDLVLDGRSVAGRLTLNQLSLQDQAGNDATLAGEFDLEQRSFDLTGKLHSTRPAQLLRSLGVEPPLMLARLSPVDAAATLRGDLEAAALTLELRHDTAHLGLDGTLHLADGQPSYDLEITAGHPDYPQLLDFLGIARSSPAERSAAFELTGRLRGDLSEQAALVGTARLGAMSLTGEADWQRGRPRPALELRLSAGEPSADALADLAALAGLRVAPALLQRPRPGAWSAEPFELAWLGGFDAEIELSGKGGVVGPGFELRARLEQGKLMVEKLQASLWQGRLEVQTSFDVRRPLPFMALAIDLRAVDPSALAAWLDLPPVIEGAADLYAEATAAGDNLRDLIGSLIGELRIGLHGGRLVGRELAELRPVAALEQASGMDATAVPVDGRPPALAVSGLEGSFALKRGIATIEALPFALEGVPAHLDGAIDLLLWAIDLKLRLERTEPLINGALGLELIGPLARPQIRLLTPPPGL